jgi:chitinase
LKKLQNLRKLSCGIALLLAIAPAIAAVPARRPVLMTFWADQAPARFAFPVPGSVDASGTRQRNAAFRDDLDDVDVLAYAFLEVDAAGDVYFRDPAVDLSAQDRGGFCAQHPTACPGGARTGEGSFDAFVRLQNRTGTLRKIISVGGAHSQRTLDDALKHPKRFVRSVTALVSAYRLDGVDLDFEPNSFFFGDQGRQLVALADALRRALGPAAFLSIELPTDWETLQSIECSGIGECHHALAALARVAYLSLMGYAAHAPSYPGPAITANDSNLFSDPNEPLLAGFDHLSDVQAIDYLTFLGVPPDRLLLGFPAFTERYAGVTHPGNQHGLFQPFQRANQRNQVGGTYRAMPRLLESGFRLHYVWVDHVISAAFAYDRRTGQWISFEDPASVAAKARYVRSHGLGGMAMWQIGGDLPTAGGRSLLAAAYRTLNADPK